MVHLVVFERSHEHLVLEIARVRRFPNLTVDAKFLWRDPRSWSRTCIVAEELMLRSLFERHGTLLALPFESQLIPSRRLKDHVFLVHP